MRLITLEGLPKVCDDVLHVLNRKKIIALVPQPMVPLSTSVQITPADTMATSFANILTRFKTLHRMNPPASTLVGGSHWIESPPIGLKERAIFHRLTQEIARVIAHELNISIDQHIIVVLKTSVHEAFEHVLTSMESRDCTINDLLEESMFLDMVTHVPGAASAFPYLIHRIICPIYMKENEHDVNITAARITNILSNL